jgi:hypothetical protein
MHSHPWRGLALCALLPAALATSIPFFCPATCASALDCSLNGACTASGACACDAGWTGHCCGQLNLVPMDYPRTSGGYSHPNTSTWGGNILLNATSGDYHMWVAEMKPEDPATGAGSCGLTTWASNSQITHVSSPALGGPYARQEVAVGVWAHNPIVRAAPDGTLVMWHIGSGGSAANATPPQGYCARNGTSPCGEQGFDHCGPPAPSPCANTSVPGYACHASACLGAGGNCGVTLAEPALQCGSPPTWPACASAAAAACQSTPGCQGFALSTQWQGLNKAKLFGAGLGATPNPQWTAWTRGGGEAAAAAAAAAALPAAGLGSCTLKMHTAPGTEGPWTPLPNVTITPCGGNNPGPFFHPNGVSSGGAPRPLVALPAALNPPHTPNTPPPTPRPTPRPPPPRTASPRRCTLSLRTRAWGCGAQTASLGPTRW